MIFITCPPFQWRPSSVHSWTVAPSPVSVSPPLIGRTAAGGCSLYPEALAGPTQCNPARVQGSECAPL